MPTKAGVDIPVRSEKAPVDVAASGVNQAERERLERMAELAALRQSRRVAVVSSPLASQTKEATPLAACPPKLVRTGLEVRNLLPSVIVPTVLIISEVTRFFPEASRFRPPAPTVTQ